MGLDYIESSAFEDSCSNLHFETSLSICSEQLPEVDIGIIEIRITKSNKFGQKEGSFSWFKLYHTIFNTLPSC